MADRKLLPMRGYSFLDFGVRYEIEKTYPDAEWGKPRSRVLSNRRCLISKSAIALAKKVKHRLNIDLFPLIVPVATKGWDVSGGTAAFCMYDKEDTRYLFDAPAHTYRAKNLELDLYIHNDEFWISTKK